MIDMRLAISPQGELLQNKEFGGGFQIETHVYFPISALFCLKLHHTPDANSSIHFVLC